MVGTERDSDSGFLGVRLSRRQLLFGGVAVAAGALSYRAGEEIASRLLVDTPEAHDLEPRLVKVGVWAVSMGINIRTSPRIPDKTRFRKPDNRLKWEEIETINGAYLEGQSAFLIINPPIVEGQDTYRGRHGADWIKLWIKNRDEVESQPYYINSSRQTEELLIWLGYAGYAEGYRADFEFLEYIEHFPREDIGRVIVPENPQTMARDIMPKLWAERMRRKFDGELGEHKLLTSLRVIAAGSEEEAREMLKLKTPVNVREYPSFWYGNNEPVNIVGRIPQGTIIDKALSPPHDGFHNRFAAVRSEDIRGELLDDQNSSFSPPAGEIYAIDLLYLSTT